MNVMDVIAKTIEHYSFYRIYGDDDYVLELLVPKDEIVKLKDYYEVPVINFAVRVDCSSEPHQLLVEMRIKKHKEDNN